MNKYTFLNEMSWMMGISPTVGELFWDEIWKDCRQQGSAAQVAVAIC